MLLIGTCSCRHKECCMQPDDHDDDGTRDDLNGKSQMMQVSAYEVIQQPKRRQQSYVVQDQPLMPFLGFSRFLSILEILEIVLHAVL